MIIDRDSKVSQYISLFKGMNKIKNDFSLWFGTVLQSNTPYGERKETGSDQLENEASWAW